MFAAQRQKRTHDRLAACERTDGELLSCFLINRDEMAFAALVERYARMVLAVCLRVLRHGHDAEDACQETFLVLWRRAASLDESNQIGGWLHGVAQNIALNARKKKRRRQNHETQCASHLLAQLAQLAEEAELHEFQTLLNAAVEGLPEKWRAPFIFSYLEGASNAEVARLLGWKDGIEPAGEGAEFRAGLAEMSWCRPQRWAGKLLAQEQRKETADDDIENRARSRIVHPASSSSLARGKLGLVGC